ncbi:MAG: hypothetical protein VXX60_04095 [Bacteroidota bacterium]|nr:hypothetical protein [Bacteroidota bacterium]
MNSLTLVSSLFPNFDAIPFVVLAGESSLRYYKKIHLVCKKGIKNNEPIIP